MTDSNHQGTADEATPSAPGETIPPHARRLLQRPPSERYGPSAEPEPTGSTPRAIVAAVIPAIVGAALLVVLASPLAVSEPLVVVALVTGVAVGLATKRGGGSRVPAGRRRTIAAAVALIAVSVAQVAIWQLALGEGGVLPIVDYLLQTFGPVAPLEATAAVLAAAAAS